MKLEDLATYDRHLDQAGGATLGWLARYGAGQAVWCGELSRATFKLQSEAVRAALRDDFGWFLVDYDLQSAERPFSRILCKVAGEVTGLELLQLIVQARLCMSLDSRRRSPAPVGLPAASKFVIGCPSAARPEAGV